MHNIAFIHGDFPFGGAERVTIDIAEYLEKKGYGTFVFATSYSKDKMPEGADSFIRVILLPEKDVVNSSADAGHICQCIREHNIETVVVVAKRLRHIQKIRETGCKIIYAHHNVPFHEARAYIDRAWIKGRRNPMRFLEWMLISYPKYVIFGQARKREKAFYEGSYSESDRYVMLCQEYKDEIVKRLGLDPSDNRIRVIANSEHVPETINYDKSKTILYTGRLSYADKRIDRLIMAWKTASEELPDWNVVIVGEGKERKNLENMAKRLGVPRIFFAGYTNNVKQYYDRASILALVSTYEGWPLCLTEAQANGVIPVAFDSYAGARHIVGTDGKTGFLVKPFDTEEFARTIVHVARLSDEEKNKIRHNAVEKARTDYAPEKIGALWEGLFEELSRERTRERA